MANACVVRSDCGIAEAVVAGLGDAPMLTSTGPIRAAISASTRTCDGTSFDPEQEASMEMRVGTRKWRARYARDMEIAEELLGAIKRDELCFRYEKVCSTTCMT